MVINDEDISHYCESLRAEGKRIVFTNGVFDIVHAGHVMYLAKARAYGDVLIVGMNNDDSVRRLKGPSRPINGEEDRALVLDALRAVDVVVPFATDTPFELISLVKPDVLVKGGDYEVENIIGATSVRNRGGQVVVIDLLEGRSTSAIIKRINQK